MYGCNIRLSVPERTLLIGFSGSNDDPDIVICESALETPSLFDFDIVICNPSSFFKGEAETAPWQSKLIGLLFYEPYNELTTRLRKETAMLLKKGGTVVCLLTERKIVKAQVGQNRDGSASYSRLSNFDWLPLEVKLERGKGTQITPTRSAGPFVKYLEMPTRYWVCYLNDLDEIPSGLSAGFLKAGEVSDVAFNVMAENEAKKAVALNIKLGGGDIILLPLSENKNTVEILLECVSEVRRKGQAKPPPDWLAKYIVPSEQNTASELHKVVEQMTSLANEKMRHENELRDKTRIKTLLYERGEQLEESVKIAFEELGFSVSKKEDIDWMIKSAEGGALLEVTGSEGQIDITKLRQLLDYLTRENRAEPTVKGILVANHYIDVEPAKRREPFTDRVVQTAQALGICLLPTTELFKVLCKAREGSLDKTAIRKKILEAGGIYKIC